MGFWKSLFNRGRSSKDNLIRSLAKQRIRDDPMSAALGLNERMVDSLGMVQLAGLPESTIVTIVETFVILKKRGASEMEIFQRIEAHRSSIGVGEMPNPLSLEAYIQYRLALEHNHGAPISESFVRNAIRVCREHFGYTEWETLNAELYRLDQNEQYDRAIVVAKKALDLAEKMGGPNHPDVAESLTNLAITYGIHEQYAQAEPLYKRALVIREKAFGPEHPDVVRSLNNLALHYRAQHQYTQAEPLYKRALAIKEHILGPEHPFVATSLDNLAFLYHIQGHYAQAESLYKRSLTIRQHALDPAHPDLAESLYNLAFHYHTQGQLALAEPLYNGALVIYENALGPDHPHVVKCLEWMSELYRKSNRIKEAELLDKRVAHIRGIPR